MVSVLQSSSCSNKVTACCFENLSWWLATKPHKVGITRRQMVTSASVTSDREASVIFFIQVPRMSLSALFVWKCDGAKYFFGRWGGGIKSIRAKPGCYLCRSAPFIHLLSDTGFSKWGAHSWVLYFSAQESLLCPLVSYRIYASWTFCFNTASLQNSFPLVTVRLN